MYPSRRNMTGGQGKSADFPRGACKSGDGVVYLSENQEGDVRKMRMRDGSLRALYLMILEL